MENWRLSSIEKKWAYVNRKGEIVAKAQYSPTWESEFFMEDTGPRYAACLQNGYVAVCREGHQGLLNYSGKEVILCEKQGVVWEGTKLQIKEQDGWHLQFVAGISSWRNRESLIKFSQKSDLKWKNPPSIWGGFSG